MARNYDIAGFGTSDGLTPQVSEKLNANFRRMLSLVTDETPRGSEMATIINEVVVDSGATGVTGVKGDLEGTYRVGQVNLTIDNIEIPMDYLEILTEWDHVINPT